MTVTKVAESVAESRHEQPDLDRRYGKIGISAVAAALAYPGEAKNPAYARVEHRRNDRASEAIS